MFGRYCTDARTALHTRQDQVWERAWECEQARREGRREFAGMWASSVVVVVCGPTGLACRGRLEPFELPAPIRLGRSWSRPGSGYNVALASNLVAIASARAAMVATRAASRASKPTRGIDTLLGGALLGDRECAASGPSSVW